MDGEHLGTELASPVIVENRPGGASTIGLAVVASATPDGQTLGILSSSFLSAPALVPSMPFDMQRDLAAVTLLYRTYFTMAVPAATGPNTFASLVERAKARPDSVRYGSPGIGTGPHLLGAALGRAIGAQLTHVPYRGAAALIGLVGNEVDLMISSHGSLAPHLKSGKVRALAINAPRRDDSWPDIPTVAELGYPSLETPEWIGVVAPRETPAAVLERTHEAFKRVLARDTVQERARAAHLTYAGLAPHLFAAEIRAQSARLLQLIREAGIRAD